MSDSVVIRFGDALDPFGNRVDDSGASLDHRGRVVDTSGYVRNLDREVCLDNTRDAQYTRELAVAIGESYCRNTVLFSTNLVAAACFDWLRSEADTSDLFNIIRQRECVIPRAELSRRSEAMRDALLEQERDGAVILADPVRDARGDKLVSLAMDAFEGYHSHHVLEPHRDGVALRDTKLLYYYQNRVVRHGHGFFPAAAR
jgi:glycerol-3-phosphate O-acyltransferase